MLRRRSLIFSPWFLPIAVGCIAAAFETPARADCAPVVAAYEKAAASGRYALFDAPTMQSATKGTPFYVRIAGDGYIGRQDRKEQKAVEGEYPARHTRTETPAFDEARYARSAGDIVSSR